MQPPKPHPASLLSAALDPKLMGAIKPALDHALTATLQRYQPNMEMAAIVIGATRRDDDWQFDINVLSDVSQDPALLPLLRTVHLVASAIADIYKDAPYDDEPAFDSAVARAQQVLQQNAVDPRLAVIFVETAIAGIFAEVFAEQTLMTLYADGRLLTLKGSLLTRLLQAYERALQGAAAPLQ